MSKLIYNVITESDLKGIAFAWQSLYSRVTYRHLQVDFIVDRCGELVERLNSDFVNNVPTFGKDYIDGAWIHNALTIKRYQNLGGTSVKATQAMADGGIPAEGIYKHQTYLWDYRPFAYGSMEYGYAESERRDGRYNVSIAVFIK